MSEPWIKRDGLWFDGLAPLAAPPPFLVGHYTAGAGDAERVHRVLVQRGLSVQFIGERDGDMFQTADLDRKCAHAGSKGNRGLGVEMVNPGYPHGSFARSWGPLVASSVHSKPKEFYAFTDAQEAAFVALAEALAAHFGWPRQVPDTDRVLTPGEIARWRGVLEHLHLTKRKVDAGMLLCGALVRAGWKPVSPR
ncbi:peptidoglycan recognition protein family protein [bacterium]|nr:peptidoglycan recognition protein family protein [bacterium]